MGACELRVAEETVSTIVVGRGLEPELPRLLRPPADGGRIVVLHDPALAGLAERVGARLGEPPLLAARAGERAKSLAEVERLAGELSRLRLGRDGLLVALGGGVIGDLGGFLAAIWQRGVPFALLPTSALAMYDAGLGGKTAVDLGELKNALGAFAWPRTVVMDVDWLATLGDDELREGLVELVKMAAILEASALDEVATLLSAVLARDPAALERSVDLAVALKVSVVREDPRDRGRRLLLNFGHTVGHAIESLHGLNVGHGSAVAAGMTVEMRLARRAIAAREAGGLAAFEAWSVRLATLLARLERPVRIPGTDDLETLWQAMTRDKKARGAEVRIAVPVAPGRGELLTVTRADLEAALA